MNALTFQRTLTHFIFAMNVQNNYGIGQLVWWLNLGWLGVGCPIPLQHTPWSSLGCPDTKTPPGSAPMLVTSHCTRKNNLARRQNAMYTRILTPVQSAC